MRLLTALPVAAMAFRHWHTDDREVEIVLAKARFRPRADGRMIADPEVPELRMVEAFAAGDPAVAELEHDQDLHPTKPATDVIVRAVARAPGGRARTDWPVEIAVGERIRHGFHVRGPSEWRRGLTGWRLSDPAPVAEVPLRYALAYGGHDPEAPEGAPEAFQSNPAGQGWASKRMLDARAPIPAPQIGLLGDFAAVRRPAQDMTVCGTMPIAKGWMPRRAEAGTFDAEWQATRHPRMPRDYSLGFWNCAPHPLRADPPLRGDEVVHLRGLSARPEPLRIALPGVGLVLDAVPGTAAEDAAEAEAAMLAAAGVEGAAAPPPAPATAERLPMRLATVELDVRDPDPARHSVTAVWSLLIEDPDRFRRGDVAAVRLGARAREGAAA